MVILRHSARINGFTGIVITKLDILDGIDVIKICISYRHKEKTYEEFPKESSIFEECEPVYEEISGWSESTSGIRDLNRLPERARFYIKKIENMLGVDVQLISTGQRRDELIQLKEQF